MNTLPTIHTNGTGPQMLLEGYLNARTACQAALDAIQQIEFNARDYYPQGPQAWQDARNEMARHQRAIHDAAQAFLAVAIHVQPFVRE